MSDDGEQLPPKTKLTTTKERWAGEGRFLTGRGAARESERLPPGQHLVRDWPVLDLGLKPDLSPQTWRLRMDGAVETPLSWSHADLMAQPQTESVSDIHCVTTWSRYDNRWNGVATSDLIAQLQLWPGARFVRLHSYDGYTTNLDLEDFLAEGAMLVHSWEGRPLTLDHGGPVRLVVPHLYFWKSAKWLKRIEFAVADKPGFWEVRGYHNRGDPWGEERYDE
ncbi:sulfite oxidase-like oxidoreductase [Aureimonas psammosilenae]|jgi:DMSO/TMAO reductase YedYZ molybdopterin-dependent catalytic subunit|uniref:sulfite oxidase-like oxidoreductase n=1 Tax=Aureimonas psammosilenae TaxID=2495496 RepID=UPI001260C8D8|nr:sulfite oxidase-like oxidoreductase [Aureimonas psammosilenae]